MNRAEKRRQQKLAEKAAKAGKESPPAQQDTGINETLRLAAQAHNAGQLAEAEHLYRQVLQSQPDNPVALQLLGVTALQVGNNEVALELISKAIAIKPDYADAHNNLGNALKGMGKPDDALASYSKAIAFNPDYADAFSNIGNVLADLGRLDEAASHHQKAIAITPQSASFHYNLANVLMEAGKLDDAIASYHKSQALAPDNADTHYNLGLAQRKAGHIAQALTSLQAAIALTPSLTDALINLGFCQNDLGQHTAAIDSLNKAIAINPKVAETHNDMGSVLSDQQEFEKAEEAFRKAIAIRPDYAEAYNNLGITLRNLRRVDEASDIYRKCLAIKPDYDEAHSNLIFLQDLIPAIDQVAQQNERKAWNDAYIQPLAATIQPHTNNRDLERPLRIGYVSADFRSHSACLGFSPLIIDHDRQNFHITCYDASPISDNTSKELRGAANSWREVKNFSDQQLAKAIRADHIDILVDLSGHTRGNRLKVFGAKPAPVQVSGIGHLAPGLSTIDYRLTTPLMTPVEEEDIYPEKPIYLKTYCAYTPAELSPPVEPPPSQKNGYITFGFLGRYSKASEEIQSLWAKILHDIPNSRLLLKFAQLEDPAEIAQIKQKFSDFGIASDRLTFLGKTSQYSHLEAHNQVDIVFDTFPHGGGITTMDSLWMGAPVIGLLQENKTIGRSVDFICSPVGLERWIARNTDEYHAIAVDWAARPQDLVNLRQGLRQHFADAYFQFHQDVEKSYRLIWQRWCRGEAPTPLHPL